MLSAANELLWLDWDNSWPWLIFTRLWWTWLLWASFRSSEELSEDDDEVRWDWKWNVLFKKRFSRSRLVFLPRVWTVVLGLWIYETVDSYFLATQQLLLFVCLDSLMSWMTWSFSSTPSLRQMWRSSWDICWAWCAWWGHFCRWILFHTENNCKPSPPQHKRMISSQCCWKNV